MDMLRFRFAVWLLNFRALRLLAYAIMTQEELEIFRDLLAKHGKNRP